MGLLRGLRELDRRSGALEWRLDSAEFFAPLNVVALLVFAGVAVWCAVGGKGQPAVLFAVFAVLTLPRTVVGLRRRRRRNANEDKWQPL